MGSTKTEKPMLQIMRELLINETHVFPISKMNSVKTVASLYGLQWDKVFTTSINREERTITVTRVK